MEKGQRVKHAPKPLWGFGPAGWVLLAIAVALAVCLITGYDLRFQLIRLIGAVFGVQAMTWFVAALEMYAFDLLDYPLLPSPLLGIPAMCALLIALQIHPQRVSWWKCALVVLAGVATPLRSVLAMKWFYPMFAPVGVLFDPRATSDAVGAATVILALITAVVVGIVCRSRLLAAGFLILGIWSVVDNMEMTRQVHGLSPLVPGLDVLGSAIYMRPAWQVCAWALPLTWAIRSRVRWRGPGLCPVCGYSLRNLPTPRCPECGNNTLVADETSTLTKPT